MFITQSIDRIRAYRRAMGWRVTELARAAGLKESTIRKLDEPDWNPESKTLERLEAVIPQGWKPGDPAPGDSRAAE